MRDSIAVAHVRLSREEWGGEEVVEVWGRQRPMWGDAVCEGAAIRGEPVELTEAETEKAAEALWTDAWEEAL